MSAFVVIPEERWVAIEDKMSRMEQALCALTERIACNGQIQKNAINGKKNIAKVLGCSEIVVTEMCRCNALGVLLWKANGKESAVMHLDNIDKAKERYQMWQSMDDNVKAAFMGITNASYVEEYWRSRYNL